MKEHVCKEIDWCDCDQMMDTPKETCIIHGCGDWPPRCAVCGRFMAIASRKIRRPHEPRP